MSFAHRIIVLPFAAIVLSCAVLLVADGAKWQLANDPQPALRFSVSGLILLAVDTLQTNVCNGYAVMTGFAKSSRQSCDARLAASAADSDNSDDKEQPSEVFARAKARGGE